MSLHPIHSHSLAQCFWHQVVLCKMPNQLCPSPGFKGQYQLSFKRKDTLALSTAICIYFIQDVHGQTYIAKVHQEQVGPYFPDEYTLTRSCRSTETTRLLMSSEACLPYARYFIHQHVKYLWSKKFHRFQMLTGIERGIQLCRFHQFSGYPAHVQETKYDNRRINDCY